MTVDIKSLIDSVIESYKIETKKKKITIRHNFDIETENGEIFHFKTDPEKLKLMLSNLLSNAVKYSYNSKYIDVHVKLENQKLEISVKDFGAGISEENQNIIFDRFKRLDSGINSINRGHGLGLSVNKALLDLLGGKISVKSQKEKGSTFSILIPENDQETSGFSGDGNEFLFEDGDESF